MKSEWLLLTKYLGATRVHQSRETKIPMVLYEISFPTSTRSSLMSRLANLSKSLNHFKLFLYERGWWLWLEKKPPLTGRYFLCCVIPSFSTPYEDCAWVITNMNCDNIIEVIVFKTRHNIVLFLRRLTIGITFKSRTYPIICVEVNFSDFINFRFCLGAFFDTRWMFLQLRILLFMKLYYITISWRLHFICGIKKSPRRGFFLL